MPHENIEQWMYVKFLAKLLPTSTCCVRRKEMTFTYGIHRITSGDALRPRRPLQRGVELPTGIPLKRTSQTKVNVICWHKFHYLIAKRIIHLRRSSCEACFLVGLKRKLNLVTLINSPIKSHKNTVKLSDVLNVYVSELVGRWGVLYFRWMTIYSLSYFVNFRCQRLKLKVATVSFIKTSVMNLNITFSKWIQI
jgi:hypothetical protein